MVLSVLAVKSEYDVLFPAVQERLGAVCYDAVINNGLIVRMN